MSFAWHTLCPVTVTYYVVGPDYNQLDHVDQRDLGSTHFTSGLHTRDWTTSSAVGLLLVCTMEGRYVCQSMYSEVKERVSLTSFYTVSSCVIGM